MKAKAKKRTNLLTYITILMVATIIVVFVNLTIEIMTDNRENIEVIQLETPKYDNPMMRESKPEREPISIEEFCKILNEIEGKEMYYVTDNKLALNENVEEITQVEETTQNVEETSQKAITEEILNQKGKGSYKEYSKEDVILLANIMYIEVEQYINDEKAEYVFKLVGSVILNRVESPQFANTLEGVIFDNTQYAQTTLDKVGTKQIPDKVYKWAEELLRDGTIGPKTLLYQSESKQGSETYYEYGNQYFCLK